MTAPKPAPTDTFAKEHRAAFPSKYGCHDQGGRYCDICPRPTPAPQIAAECWTCRWCEYHRTTTRVAALYCCANLRPFALSAREAEECRSIGHDVRKVGE